MFEPFIMEKIQQVIKNTATQNPKPNESEIAFQINKVITRNGKYKYIQDMNSLYNYDYVDNFDLLNAYEKDKTRVKMPMGIQPGELDYYLLPGINVIAGMPGHGKSMLGNSIAYRNVKYGNNVLYISLEICKKLILYQMVSIHSFETRKLDSERISHSDIKAHNLCVNQEHEAFVTMYDEFKNLKGKLFTLDEWDFDTSSSIELQKMLFGIEEYAQATTGRGIDLIIVDYIQLFKKYKEQKSTSEYEILSLWINDFRKMSNNFLGQNREIPIVILSQLNRDAWSDLHEIEKKKSKNDSLPPGKKKSIPELKINISQIAGCAEICKAASTVFAIRSDESLKGSEQCQIFMLKNRDGYCPEGHNISYMNAKYYTVGFTNKEEKYTGTLEEILQPHAPAIDCTLL